MGYACPVCGDPQADGGHLANHLAFTAILGDDDHERWLDEHAPGWSQEGEDELAERVVEHAEAVEFPQVFEDTTGEGTRAGHEHEHADTRGRQHGDVSGARRRGQGGPSDPEVERILAEAREMTREMLDADAGGSDDPAEPPGDADGDGGDGDGGNG